MGSILLRGGVVVRPDRASSRSPARISSSRDGGVRAEDTDVLVVDRRIAAVGALGDRPADEIVDARGHAVLPGLVQSHVHLCQTLFRGVAGDLPLLEWLQDRIWPLEAAHDPASIRAAARLGIAELLLGGTTAVQTMETVRHTGEVLDVVEGAGLFAVVGKCLMDDPETSPASLVESTDAALQEAVDLAEAWEGRSDRLQPCLAPRFAVSCTDRCLQEVGRLAAERGWRIHTHAAENRDEAALVEARSGRRSVEHLDALGCSGDHVGLAHCVHVDDAEIGLLASSGTHVLHCPSSNCKLGSGIAPVPRLLAAGVPVSLGADGAPCNDNLDVFREMRLAALIQKPAHGAAAMRAGRVLHMATAAGGAALGQPGEIGVLEPGAWADVVLVRLGEIHSLPSPDPAGALVYAAGAADVRSVWLAGRQVVADGHLTLWDEDEVRRDAVREFDRLVRRAGLD